MGGTPRGPNNVWAGPLGGLSGVFPDEAKKPHDSNGVARRESPPSRALDPSQAASLTASPLNPPRSEPRLQILESAPSAGVPGLWHGRKRTQVSSCEQSLSLLLQCGNRLYRPSGARTPPQASRTCW